MIMYNLKDLEIKSIKLKYNDALIIVRKDVSMIMRRPCHLITTIKRKEGNTRRMYGYGLSKRTPKNLLGGYWLTPLIYKGGEALYTIEPALHSVPDISLDDMFKEDWEVLKIKRWNEVSINDCD